MLDSRLSQIEQIQAKGVVPMSYISRPVANVNNLWFDSNYTRIDDNYILDKQFKYVSQVYRISFKDSLEGNRYRYLLEQLSYRMADTIREIDEQIS